MFYGFSKVIIKKGKKYVKVIVGNIHEPLKDYEQGLQQSFE
jgi:hypothetical protein